MPVTVVPTSSATVAIDTFMTELSRVIKNCAAASVMRTMPAPSAAGAARGSGVDAEVAIAQACTFEARSDRAHTCGLVVMPAGQRCLAATAARPWRRADGGRPVGLP